MEKWKCKICGKEINYKGVKSETYVRCHIQRSHKITYFEYLYQYYNNIGENKEIEKCNFCKTRDAVPNLNVNHKDATYFFTYENGYFCQTDECKNEISLKILGKPYDKQFEYIGSRVDYLSILHKKDVKEINYSKSRGFRDPNFRFVVLLENFIKLYGIEEGTKKYKERNKKISYSNTKQFYFDKYGEEEANERWAKRQAQLERFICQKYTSQSKASLSISNLLKNLNISFEDEKPYKNENFFGKMDYYLPDYNIIIEYYGVYWHCHPKKYKGYYYNSRLKSFAYEIWERDKKRLNFLHNHVFEEQPSIIVIWEKSKIDEIILYDLINTYKNLKTIVYYG